MSHIANHEPIYPELNRATFLIEHACVPRYLPPVCPETAQILAALAEAAVRRSPQENNS